MSGTAYSFNDITATLTSGYQWATSPTTSGDSLSGTLSNNVTVNRTISGEVTLTPVPVPQPVPVPVAPSYTCHYYDLYADGGETVTFTYQRCNTGNTLTITVPNGDSAQICARTGSVDDTTGSGTVIQGSSCG